jgi:hypothetical protein
MHVFGVDNSPGFEEEFDGFFLAKSRGAVQWRFAFCAAIAHECSGFDAWFGSYIRVGSVSEEYLYHPVVDQAVCLAYGVVKGCFACIAGLAIHVCALFQQEFAEAPMAVVCGGVQAIIFAQGIHGLTVCQQESYRAYVAVICAVVD